MPAVKMKTKTSTGCLREGQNLHLCHKQNKISKSSHFVKLYQHASAPDGCTPRARNAFEEEKKSDEAVDLQDFCREQSVEVLDTPKSADAVPSDPQLAALPSILETIFSPVLDNGEGQVKLPNGRDAGVDKQGGLPHLDTDESDDSSCSSHEDKPCNVSDHLISDLSASAFSFDGSVEFSELIHSASPDDDHINSELIFDVDEEYLMLPMSERDPESNQIHDDSSDVPVLNMDDPFMYLAIHQFKSSEQDTEIGHCFGDDDADSFDPHIFIKNLPDISEAVSSLWPVLLPQETRRQKSITLVLDLDETLVHSSLEHCDGADFTFPVFFNMKEHTVYVKRRPHLNLFLERVSEMFKIVIFTASQSIYAEQLLDILDPSKRIISQRIYRESCIFSEGTYTKDLTILGLDLAKVAIIDNTPQVFRLQVNNGIPIKSWFDDPSDSALISLLPFLETLANADDVRPLIAKKFNNEEQ